MRKPLISDGINGHGVFTPMGIAVLSAIFMWTAFIVLKRVSEGSPDRADKIEAEREKKTLWFTGGAASGSQTPTGNGFFASAINAAAFGAIGGKGAADGAVDVGLSQSVGTYAGYVAQGGNAAISQSTAMQPVVIKRVTTRSSTC
jgi:hypothetical protein